MRSSFFLCASLIFFFWLNVSQADGQVFYQETYRPQIHFSPKQHWVNDPNGMVFYKGTYHLFFQYYPGGTNWGPMHWGHAQSSDLVHWKEGPIALYPDRLGYIFSGSAVVDSANSSGFGKGGVIPIVAVFTHHDPKGEMAGRDDFQTQSIAYSLDSGKTFTKYEGNPVLKNPGIRDFRDPKLIWFAPQQKWVMTLATKDRVTFYSSRNLKDWVRESDFGADMGAHGGVWECPDLFMLKDQGKPVWVLTANINPGAPNKGSATQYFLGDFDGHSFIARDGKTRWVDYGPDEYAGVTWSNTGSRKIFLGWMSNWRYAGNVPTVGWRNAMTLPRSLGIKHVGKEAFLASEPVVELNKLQAAARVFNAVLVKDSVNLSGLFKGLRFPFRLDMTLDTLRDFSIVLANALGENVVIGYDGASHQFFVDRTHSGITNFEKEFAQRAWAPRFALRPGSHITMIVEQTSVEFFGDDGLSVLTSLFFPSQPYDRVLLKSKGSLRVPALKIATLKSIWE